MKKTTQMTNDNRLDKREPARPTGGLAIRTDLRAGLAWDDLDDKAQKLWGSLTSAVSGLTGGTGTSS
ncbi:MAG: hypothetical protein KDE53_17040 [Caldilineaceae bacterium]|nr:hypothetical protein [Caldilineaceae bacterium]